MNFLSIIPYYFSWHYSQGTISYFRIQKNLIWFLWNFFSIKILLKTFFAPFEKLKENYTGGLDIENWLSSVLVTTLMRLVGMFARSVIIVTGLITILAFLIIGFFGIFVWLALPFIILGMFFTSIIALTK
jgi:hypothetical protein